MDFASGFTAALSDLGYGDSSTNLVPSQDQEDDVPLLQLERPRRRLLPQTTRPWCPSQSDYLENRYPGLLNIFEKLQPLKPTLDHESSGCCRSQQCRARPVDSASNHVCLTRDCVELSISEDDLLPLWRADEIPILYLDHSQSRTHIPVLKVRKRKRNDIYVAISHVWADGLGNSEEHALPWCRMKSLLSDIAAVLSTYSVLRKPKLGFWFDTFCIPLAKSEEHQILKAQQIAKMTAIYSQAFATLVLDSGLMSIQEPQWNDELLAQIITSQWATRSWCYQESALSEQCAYKFRNDILLLARRDLNIRKARVPLGKRHKPDLEAQYEMELHRRGQPVDGLRSITWLSLSKAASGKFKRTRKRVNKDDDVSHELWKAFADQGLLVRSPWRTAKVTELGQSLFLKVWNDLAGSYTSQPEDVTLIFATVLDLQISPLLTIPAKTKDRMRRICLSFNFLPLSLLFTPEQTECESSDEADWWIPQAPGHHVLDEGPDYIAIDRDKSFAIIVLASEATSDSPRSLYDILQIDATLMTYESLLTFDLGQGPRSYKVTSLTTQSEGQTQRVSDQDKAYVIMKKTEFGMSPNTVKGIYLHQQHPATRGSESGNDSLHSSRELPFSCTPIMLHRVSSEPPQPNAIAYIDPGSCRVFRIALTKPLANDELPLDLHERSDLKSVDVRSILESAIRGPLGIILSAAMAAGGVGGMWVLRQVSPSGGDAAGLYAFAWLLAIGAVIGGLARLGMHVLVPALALSDWIKQSTARRRYLRRHG